MTKAHGLIYQLRKAGISAEGDHLDRSVRAQMKYANKIGASYSFILGDEELKVQKVALKNMDTGEQEEVELSKLVETMKQKIEA